MRSKITISTTKENIHLFSKLAEELGIEKNEVFDKALNYFSDMVEVSIINKRLKSIKDGKEKIYSLEEFNKAIQ